MISQAFGFALQEELHDYYRLLAILDQELNRRNERMAVSTGSDAKEFDNEFEKEKALSSSGLTILRLRAWMEEPLDRMYIYRKKNKLLSL